MKTICKLLALTLLLFAASAWAQLKPYTDYEPSEGVSHISTIRVQANMIDDYLEGIRQTWVASNKVAKELGHIDDYVVYVSDLPSSGDFNIVLVVRYAKGADMQPSKERYDAFMKAWGDANQGKVREIVKNYPAMREITGEYVLRTVTFK
ncbi:MAG: hypothetical protein K0M70_07540 [Arenimonas sp.]|uniref:hypothetical protein n=1 Tax=Arenimonas sp. TaxID=1872635 RepID=UPI0025C25230|nr:hypothetical protein [Arenimonas sp.]MBW8367692.1 hypothetical protein [Arenimonas sp.]